MNEDSKFWKTKKFSEINNTWKKKLKDSGFKDIETDDDRLSTWSSSEHNKNHNHKDKGLAKEMYYRLAGFLLHEYRFKSEEQKTIWELHANGVSLRNIVKEIKAKKSKHGYVYVYNIVSKLAKIMKTNYGVNHE